MTHTFVIYRSLVQAVSRQMQGEAEDLLYASKNTFFFPHDRRVIKKLQWSELQLTPGESPHPGGVWRRTAGIARPLFRNVDVALHMQDLHQLKNNEQLLADAQQEWVSLGHLFLHTASPAPKAHNAYLDSNSNDNRSGVSIPKSKH